MLIYLQCKLITLASEAQNIRKKEQQCKAAAVKTSLFAKENIDYDKDAVRLASCGYNLNQIKRILQRALSAHNKLTKQEYDRAISQNMEKFWGLRNHRTNELRREARSSFLAYGFLRGHDYNTLEDISFTPPDWSRIEQIVRKFGEDREQDLMQRFSEWKDNAHIGSVSENREEWVLQYRKLQNAKPGSVKQWTGWSIRWKEKHEAKRQEHLVKLKERKKNSRPEC